MRIYLVLDFAQKLFLAHVVQPESFPNASNQFALERHDGEGNIIRLGLHALMSTC